MSGTWTLIDTHPTHGRTFRRPLGVVELSFLWDRFFNGTADNIQHVQLRLSHGPRDAHLFSEANIVRAWVSTKRRYPLAGATVVQDTPQALVRLGTGLSIATPTQPHFVVREADLAVLRPGEIVFGEEVADMEEVRQRAVDILNASQRPLSETPLVQLYVFREKTSICSDTASTTPVRLHVMTLMAHCVTDGVANYTFMRCFLDTLARGYSEPAQLSLEERLAMVVPVSELEPVQMRSLSLARRRWRRAVGLVIAQLWMAKRQGGHTLPCRISHSTPRTAARSGHVSTRLTHVQSAAVITNCRLHNITFGNAYLPLAQVAMTRVLYRRYLRGEISEEEWAYRKRQPYINGGPLNLRPYLDKEWLKLGGGGEFMVSIGFFHRHLPFMTLGSAAEQVYGHGHHDKHEAARILSDGAPPFSELLTFDRFLHRVGLIQQQTTAFFNHPLFFEIVHAMHVQHLERTWLSALRWMKRLGAIDGIGTQESLDDEVLAVTDVPVALAHGGSSLGNVDAMFPSEYPLPPTHPLSPYAPISHPVKAGYVTPPLPAPSTFTRVSEAADESPTIVIEDVGVKLHTRPGELYLGASSLRGIQTMFAFYDGNVFEEEVVREWLEEVKGAVLWYLGRTHRPRARQSRPGRDSGVESGLNHGSSQAGLARPVGAKL